MHMPPGMAPPGMSMAPPMSMMPPQRMLPQEGPCGRARSRCAFPPLLSSCPLCCWLTAPPPSFSGEPAVACSHGGRVVAAAEDLARGGGHCGRAVRRCCRCLYNHFSLALPLRPAHLSAATPDGTTATSTDKTPRPCFSPRSTAALSCGPGDRSAPLSSQSSKAQVQG